MENEPTKLSLDLELTGRIEFRKIESFISIPRLFFALWA